MIVSVSAVAWDTEACARLLQSSDYGDYATLLLAAKREWRVAPILADWLQEHNFENLPEFIRLQADWLNRSPYDPARKRLVRSAIDVLRRPGNAWIPPSPVFQFYQFSAGLPRARPFALDELGTALRSQYEDILLTGVEFIRLGSREDLRSFLDHPNLKRPMVYWRIEGRSTRYSLGHADAALIAHHEKASEVLGLDLLGWGRRPWDPPHRSRRVVKALISRSSRLDQLLELDLTRTDVEPDELELLFSSTKLKKLEMLRLRDNLVAPPRSSQYLFGRSGEEDLPAPRILDLAFNDLGGESKDGKPWVRSLRMGAFTKLEELNLRRTGISLGFVASILKGENANFLRTRLWNLSDNNFGDGGLEKVLARGAKMAATETLLVERANLPYREVLAFEKAHHPLQRNLKVLSWAGNYLGRWGGLYFSRAQFDSLYTLNLGKCSLGTSGLRNLLAKGSQIESWPLDTLDLSYNHLDEDAVEVLIEATDVLRRIRYIDLKGLKSELGPVARKQFELWVRRMRRTTVVED